MAWKQGVNQGIDRTSQRADCANTGRSPMASGTRHIDPERPLKIGYERAVNVIKLP
jgi:hypothetical protein